LDFTLHAIRPTYRFDVSCQGSVPQALCAFLESSDYESAIRNAISLGGDSDTLAAMAGSVAEAAYGIPEYLREEALIRLPQELQTVVREFELFCPARIV
ncbi:MAG: ADP-ribosylglycohydrolase family protein, partial [Mailhella sp.]|nr:ADP-ribosylglycohydrolase family protein [Mailhella sp.]